MYERLKRMYQDGRITPVELLSAVEKGFVTLNDVVEIVGEENATEMIRDAKIAEISATCNAMIVAGFDIDLSGETEHFNLSLEDQSNIANLFRVVELGGNEYPYQADGGRCRIYTAQEIARIYIAAQTIITTQTTYHNALKEYVAGLDDTEKIVEVQYGMDLPAPYDSEVHEKLSIATTQMNAIMERLGGAV